MCSFNNYINFHALHVLITSILIPLTFCAIVSHVLVLAIFPNWAVPKIIPILSDKQLKVIWKCSPLLVLSNKIKIMSLPLMRMEQSGHWQILSRWQLLTLWNSVSVSCQIFWLVVTRENLNKNCCHWRCLDTSIRIEQQNFVFTSWLLYVEMMMNNYKYPTWSRLDLNILSNYEHAWWC